MIITGPLPSLSKINAAQKGIIASEDWTWDSDVLLIELTYQVLIEGYLTFVCAPTDFWT